MMVMISVLESGADRVADVDAHRDDRPGDGTGERGLVERLLRLGQLGLRRVDVGLVAGDLLGRVGAADRSRPAAGAAAAGVAGAGVARDVGGQGGASDVEW